MYPLCERRVLLTSALALLAGCAQFPDAAAPQACQATHDQLLAAIRAVHEKQKNVGVQTAIYLDGRLVFSNGLGLADREKNIPVSPDTVFPLASITKAFTGVATLKAHAAGKIDLDAPIQKYVPEFPVKPELEITPRRLAAHRAGIHHWGTGIARWGIERESLYARHFDRLEQILPLFKDDPLRAKAGEEYQYSSLGYNLLALAVERATGVEFTDDVGQQILAPLGLSNTRFDDARKPAPPGMTKLYTFYDLKTFAVLPDPAPVPVLDYSHNMAGGNMSATAGDLVKFGAALIRPGFLPPREYAMLFEQPAFGGKPTPVSFGFFNQESGAETAGPERILRINGANPGMMAALNIYPERRLAVAVLANTWGIDSRSGEMTGALPRQLADLCVSAAAKD